MVPYGTRPWLKKPPKPPTERQLAYLRHLYEEAGQAYVEPADRMGASRRIAVLLDPSKAHRRSSL
jgi:hypothetical protein